MFPSAPFRPDALESISRGSPQTAGVLGRPPGSEIPTECQRNRAISHLIIECGVCEWGHNPIFPKATRLACDFFHKDWPFTYSSMSCLRRAYLTTSVRSCRPSLDMRLVRCPSTVLGLTWSICAI